MDGKCPSTGPASKKRVCWIDPHLEYRSPTMLHLLHSLQRLRDAGWEIEAWCFRSDAPRDQVRHVFLPTAKWLGPFEGIWFTVIANLYGLWRRPARDKGRIIHASCGVFFGADVASVHFVNSVWLATQYRLGFRSWREIAKFLMGIPGALFERIALRSRSLRKVLAVSDSIAAEVRKLSRPGLEIQVFPNSFDETRFRPAVRALHRDAMRAALGLDPLETVFIFVSQGHFERKGLWLALDALSRLQTGKRLRLLVVGGTPASLDALRKRLTAQFPGWEKWVILAGMQREVEKYYAAADAFILPSYFEANPLVAMEAGAMGLPLLLTPFHGSEMILRDGVNGLLLDYDPARMSGIIARFLDGGLPPFAPGPGRGLDREQYAARLLAVYEEMAGGGAAGVPETLRTGATAAVP